MTGQTPQPSDTRDFDADAAAAGADARRQQLERSIRELRVAVAELREQQIEILERLDGRIAQLQSRTNHLNHLVAGNFEQPHLAHPDGRRRCPDRGEDYSYRKKMTVERPA